MVRWSTYIVKSDIYPGRQSLSMSGFRWPAADKVPRFPREKTSGTQGKSDKTIYTTSNNQSLRSAGDNNRKSKEGLNGVGAFTVNG